MTELEVALLVPGDMYATPEGLCKVLANDPQNRLLTSVLVLRRDGVVEYKDLENAEKVKSMSPTDLQDYVRKDGDTMTGPLLNDVSMHSPKFSGNQFVFVSPAAQVMLEVDPSGDIVARAITGPNQGMSCVLTRNWQ